MKWKRDDRKSDLTTKYIIISIFNYFLTREMFKTSKTIIYVEKHIGLVRLLRQRLDYF